jgi:hypothetical protein
MGQQQHAVDHGTLCRMLHRRTVPSRAKLCTVFAQVGNGGREGRVGRGVTRSNALLSSHFLSFACYETDFGLPT